jgi:hypothetical protein
MGKCITRSAGRQKLLAMAALIGLSGAACTVSVNDEEETSGGTGGRDATGGSTQSTGGSTTALTTGGSTTAPATGGSTTGGVTGGKEMPPVDANPCTGPGPANPDNVQGFPPGPAATLTGGAWDGWGVSYGKLDEAADVDGVPTALHTAAPSETRTSYFHMPESLLGDLSGVAGVSFWLRTEAEGGEYYESGYAYKGDLVLKGASGDTTAFAMLSHAPDSEWHQYYVPFQASETCWSLGADELQALLSNVTGLGIRAEFSTGKDNTWLSDVRLVRR